MTTITVEASNFKIIEEIKQLLKNKFGNKVVIEENKQIREKWKWANFADRMSGLTTPEITEHIKKSSKEVRENFQFRNLTIKN